LTPAQEAQWRQATQRLARPLQEIQLLRKQLEAVQATLAEREEPAGRTRCPARAGRSGTACEVDQVAGSVAVQAICRAARAAGAGRGRDQEAAARTARPRLVKSRLFHGDSGRYAWAPPTKEA
jgi:hypothetical protein